MFNYKIRQKNIDFFKITNPYPALKVVIVCSAVFDGSGY